MNINEYQKTVRVKSGVAINALGVVGECGELYEALYTTGSNALDEAGDVLFYCANLASSLKVDLQTLLENDYFEQVGPDKSFNYHRFPLMACQLAEASKKYAKRGKDKHFNLVCDLLVRIILLVRRYFFLEVVAQASLKKRKLVH